MSRVQQIAHATASVPRFESFTATREARVPVARNRLERHVRHRTKKKHGPA